MMGGMIFYGSSLSYCLCYCYRTNRRTESIITCFLLFLFRVVQRLDLMKSKSSVLSSVRYTRELICFDF
uniref:Uncharacterized protein n=1 Tax=Oryza brachyantha TaxID=4533 RepID=J3LW86_ORYBR